MKQQIGTVIYRSENYEIIRFDDSKYDKNQLGI